MVETLQKAAPLHQGLFIMAAGVGGVFLVLILFFILIKVITKFFPEENSVEK